MLSRRVVAAPPTKSMIPSRTATSCPQDGQPRPPEALPVNVPSQTGHWNFVTAVGRAGVPGETELARRTVVTMADECPDFGSDGNNHVSRPVSCAARRQVSRRDNIAGSTRYHSV